MQPVHQNFKTLHLKISAIAILFIGTVYGFFPNKFFPGRFDFSVATIDLKNIFRATMGLYIGMVVIWIAGIINPKIWAAATLTNIAFMGGLAAGRLVSLLVDGMPTIYFIYGLAGELLLAVWGIYNLVRYSSRVKD
jgi:hypothetical protein